MKLLKSPWHTWATSDNHLFCFCERTLTIARSESLLEYILLCQVMFTICFLLAGQGDKKKRVQFSDTFWRHCYCVSVSLCILQKFRTNISALSWGFDFFSWIEIIKFVEVFHQQYSPNVMQATQVMSTKTGH